MTLLANVILRNTRLNQPAANAVAPGTLYYVTDEQVTERSTGSAWEDVSDHGTGTYLLISDIDDTPVNGETAAPISSNWAFDHEAAADPHPGYLTPAEGDAAYDAIGAASAAVASHAGEADPHAGYVLESLIDAKGDLIAGSANDTVVRFAVGADGDILRAAAGAAAGLEWQKNNLAAAVAPTANEDSGDGYSVGSLWLDTTADKAYICLDATLTAAVWTEITQQASGIAESLIDAKGDLIAGSADNTAARVAVGSNGSILRAASGAAAGIEWQKNDLAAAAPPTVSDDTVAGYSVGSRWCDTTADKEYVCLDATEGAAVWTETTQVTHDASAGRHAVPIMAAAITPSATGGCAALATIASAANQPDISTLNFDATTQEYAQFSVPMPKSWNEGTVTFKPIWSHAATDTNFGVVWSLQAIALSDDDAIAQAFGTAQTSTDTGGTTNDIYVGPESSAITIAGTPTAEDVVFFRVSRVATDGSDTLAIDARLHGVVLYMTTDAENDA